MLAYKIKDLNVNPVRGPEVKMLACPSKRFDPYSMPSVWLPIYSRIPDLPDSYYDHHYEVATDFRMFL